MELQQSVQKVRKKKKGCNNEIYYDNNNYNVIWLTLYAHIFTNNKVNYEWHPSMESNTKYRCCCWVIGNGAVAPNPNT